MKDLSWEQREAMVKEKENAVVELQKLEKSLVKSNPLFERIAAHMPEDFWLDNLTVSLGANGKYTVTMHGFGFLADATQERLAIDGLVAKFKKDPVLGTLFSSIDLVSSERKEIRQFMVTSFTLKME